jgi:hypothetical protein
MIAEIAEEMREMPFMMTEFHGDRPLFVPPYRAKPERHGSLFLRTASAARCGAARLLGRRGRRRQQDPSYQEPQVPDPDVPAQRRPVQAADRRPDVGKLRGSRADLRARRRCVGTAGRCSAPALSASVEATRQRGAMPDGHAERGGRHRVTRGSFTVGALGFSDDDDRGASGYGFEEIGSSYG